MKFRSIESPLEVPSPSVHGWEPIADRNTQDHTQILEYEIDISKVDTCTILFLIFGENMKTQLPMILCTLVLFLFLQVIVVLVFII